MMKISILFLAVFMLIGLTVAQVDDGEDGAPSKDNRCNGLIWADMCVRDQSVVKDCENAPEGKRRGDKCRHAARLCKLRPGAKPDVFAKAVKKSCHD
jgi:hypothetical protein